LLAYEQQVAVGCETKQEFIPEREQFVMNLAHWFGGAAGVNR
jgi:hypothetical protein